MSGLLASYQSLLTRRPMYGNMLTSGVLFATGDVIAQQVIEKKGSDHDLGRTARIVAWGGGIFAPAVTVWFRALERIPIRSKWPAAMVRTGLDQFAFAPCILTGFFTVMTLLEGKDLNAVKRKWTEVCLSAAVERDQRLNTDQAFVPTLQANWSVFIPVQILNMLVPLQYRLLVINGVNIPWNAFLSLQNAKGKKATGS